MSSGQFHTKVTDELVRYFNFQPCCMYAELYSVIKNCATLRLSSPRNQIVIECREIAVLKKTAALLKDLFDASIEIDVSQRTIFRSKRLFKGTVTDSQAVREVLGRFHMLAITDKEAGVDREFLLNPCCRAAFLRGTFLSRGYLGNPTRHYLLEFNFSDLEFSDFFCQLLHQEGIRARRSSRKRNLHVVYIKDGDSIVRFLALTKAVKTLLELENVRVLKSVRGDANRQTNFDTANIERLSQGASRQLEAISYLKKEGLLEALDEDLRVIAELRLECPWDSLRDLGDLTLPKVSKSTVAYRMKKIIAYYHQLCPQKKKG